MIIQIPESIAQVARTMESNKRKRPATSSSSSNGKVKKSKSSFTKESFLNDLKKHKLYTEDDRYFNVKTDNIHLELPWKMDWLAEARAVIDDVRPYVSSIDIANGLNSTDMRIFFDVTILEGEKFVVSMDSYGFSILGESEEPTDTRVYETINSLLDANSPKYREEFARTLTSRMNSLEPIL